MFPELTCGGFGGKNAKLSVIFVFLLSELMSVPVQSHYKLTRTLTEPPLPAVARAVARAVAKEATVSSRELAGTSRSCGYFDQCRNPCYEYNALLIDGSTERKPDRDTV